MGKILQDIVACNLQQAIHNNIDPAARIIGEKGIGFPGGIIDMFYLLEEYGYLKSKLTEKMVRAVCFRKLIVYECTRRDLC